MSNHPPRALSFFSPEYHDLIGLIYDAVNSEGGFFPFLQRFTEVFDGHSATFSIFDLKAEAVVGAWVINIPVHALTFYAEHIGHQDALVQTALAASKQGQSRFVASNLDLGDKMPEIREKTRAGEWLASYGAHEAAGAIAFQNDNYLNFFGIQRSIEQPAFTREQLEVFDLFLPHLNRAVGLYTKMSSLSAAQPPERLALNHIQRGILVFDAGFKVVFRNAAAKRIIAANAGMELSEAGLLSFRDKNFSSRFVIAALKAIEASIAGRDSTEMVLCYRQGSQNITAVISPLSSIGDGGGNQGGAMLSLYDWSLRPSVDVETLRHFFDLTEAEAKVSALLAQGESMAEIAEHVNRSRETVKSHIKSVFRKTNTSRQGELVALLSSVKLS